MKRPTKQDSAAKLLAKAHAALALWNGFPPSPFEPVRVYVSDRLVVYLLDERGSWCARDGADLVLLKGVIGERYNAHAPAVAWALFAMGVLSKASVLAFREWFEREAAIVRTRGKEHQMHALARLGYEVRKRG